MLSEAGARIVEEKRKTGTLIALFAPVFGMIIRRAVLSTAANSLKFSYNSIGEASKHEHTDIFLPVPVGRHP